MERVDACLTRRPLLEGAEEEVETALPTLPVGGAASRGARRQPGPEDRYALLQGGLGLEEEGEVEPQETSESWGRGAADVGAADVDVGGPLAAAAAAGDRGEREDDSPEVVGEAACAAATEAPAAEGELDGLAVRQAATAPETPGPGPVVIEMQSLAPQPEGSACPSSEELPAEAQAQAPRGRGSNDRHCFICLQDGGKDSPLVRCCSTCYACTHVRCWRDWRSNQRITALRSRLLGLRMPTNNLLRCTICKSGTAVLAGEEDGLEWMNELLCGNEPGNAGGEESAPGRAFGGALAPREDSDEDADAQLEDLIDMRTCFALMVYLGVLILVLLLACTLIVMQQFYAGDVVLCCIIALYELSVLQIVALAVARRRGAMLSTAASSEEGGDLEAQRGARELPLAELPRAAP